MKCTQKDEIHKEVPRTSETIELPQTRGNERTMKRTQLTLKEYCKENNFSWVERLMLPSFFTGSNGYRKERSPAVLGTFFRRNTGRAAMS